MDKLIQSLSLKNFYNYYGGFEHNHYEFGEGLNIIVADNGAGKSKFFNAILWLLTNTVLDSSTKKIVDVDEAAFSMISDKAKCEIEIEEGIETAVQLIFKVRKIEYSVTKFFYATKIKEGSPTDSSCWKLNKIKQKLERREVGALNFKPVVDKNEQDKIIETLIPKMFKKYLLLQGEEIDNMVDFSNKNSIKEAIETITNIDQIEQLKILAQGFYKRAEKELNKQIQEHSNNQELLTGYIDKKDSLEKEIKKLDEEKIAIEVTLAKAIEKKDAVYNDIGSVEKRNEFRRELVALEKEKKRLEANLEQFERNLNSYFFNESYLWLVFGTTGIDKTFSEKIEKYREERQQKIAALQILNSPEEFLSKYSSKLPSDIPDALSLSKMLKEECCFVCGREAQEDSEAWNHIKHLKGGHKKAKQSLTLKNDFTKFFDAIQVQAQVCYTKVDKIEEQIQEMVAMYQDIKNKIHKTEEEIREVQTSFIDYGGSLGEEGDKDNNLLHSYENSIVRIQEAEAKIRKIEQELVQRKQEQERVDKDIQSADSGKFSKNYKLCKNLLYDVATVVENTKERIYKELLEELESMANRYFVALIKKNNANGGNLKFSWTSETYDSVRIDVVDPEGNKISGLSEGFQRMKKLAVIMAIVKTSKQGFDHPFIADAPLSAFGKGFISGFFEEVPKVFSQSIILVKELYDITSNTRLTEIGVELLEKMNKEGTGRLYVNEVEKDSVQTNMQTKILVLK